MPFHRRLACKLNYFQSIILLFAAVILIGAALLMLPISAQERTVTPFHEALFTATSAVCVTGLVVRDTASHWSAFGQAVLDVYKRQVYRQIAASATPARAKTVEA